MCRLTVPLELLIVKLLNELAERVQLKKKMTHFGLMISLTVVSRTLSC
jgi:hypothetical protein